ncbi:MAG: putative MPP superfamily phosphohydrolase [Hyphomicrobiaceae bacterium]|jgi:predicted MPP superfamily phosphohydrolase
MGIDAHAGIVGAEPLLGKDCPAICVTSVHTAAVAVLVLCSAFDVAGLVFGVALAWRVRFRSGWLEWLQLLAFAGCMLTISGVLMRTLGGFAMLRGLTHAIFCVVLPVMAVRAVRLRSHSLVLCILWLLAFVAGEATYVFAKEIEPRRLEVTHAAVTSPRLRTLAKPLVVACVADLQTDRIGAYEVRAFDELVACQPDVVLFLGDYLQVRESELGPLLPLFHEQLRRIKAPLGMYAVDGDVDQSAGGVKRIFAGTEVTVLIDDRISLPGVPIDITGLSRMRSRAKFLDRSVVASLRGDRFPIVIGHAPDFMLSVVRDSLDPDALMVAGHTHGGQIQIPGFGPPVIFSAVPRWLGGGGLFANGKAWLCCCRGIGLECGDAPRVRLFCRPQLVVLTLSGR